MAHDSEKVEEEFVLLDLNAVSEQVDIQPNAPYVLSVCLSNNLHYPFCLFHFFTCEDIVHLILYGIVCLYSGRLLSFSSHIYTLKKRI